MPGCGDGRMDWAMVLSAAGSLFGWGWWSCEEMVKLTRCSAARNELEMFPEDEAHENRTELRRTRCVNSSHVPLP